MDTEWKQDRVQGICDEGSGGKHDIGKLLRRSEILPIKKSEISLWGREKMTDWITTVTLSSIDRNVM